MATQAEESGPDAQVVGNAFVQEYYNFLTQWPENVHKFYQDTSVVSRLDSDGLMRSTTTLNGIDKVILSQDSKNCMVEILTVDAQESSGSGVIVFVTGFFTGKGKVRRKFTQVFFLAPQGDGHAYFVLNDVLRYVDEEELATTKTDDADDNAPTAPVTPDPGPEPSLVSNPPVLDTETIPVEELPNQAEESSYPLENGKISTTKGEADANHSASQSDSPLVSVASSENDNPSVSAAAASDVPENAPKKSYASIANELNFKKQPFQQRISPPKPVQKRLSVVAPEVTSRPAGNSFVEKNKNHAVKGHSIFVANLPMTATEEQLRETFQRFGPIKSNGVRVRSYQIEKSCFGFVEFESADSMRKAVEASYIMIGNQRAHIEEKRANNDGGKYHPRRGDFRNDNFRNRGNSNGGRGNRRNDPESRSGLSSQARGSGDQPNGETIKKFHQNGEERLAGQEQAQAL